MKLYLVQHAKATSKEVDPRRPLSEQGLAEIQKVAAFVRPLNLHVDRLWHSGKTRAVQTADVLAEVIDLTNAPVARDDLGPTDDVTAIKNELSSAAEDIMIVGHLPFLSKLASLLLTGSESAGTVAFRNAGVVAISRSEQEQWQTDWIVVPDILP
ncbi:MAG: phosphohistidine phosphatase SixA [Phycisphaerales bacterium]|nr:MAG: phosphohistidine phosphatase SixA [Phycisphaerales bacterium]